MENVECKIGEGGGVLREENSCDGFYFQAFFELRDSAIN
jgi:hypothetical protein